MEASMRAKPWRKRWNTWINPKPVLPGVYKRKEAGFLVRGRLRDRETGKRKEIKLTLPEVTDPKVARKRLEEELERAQMMSEPSAATPLFCDFAICLLERKITTGEIKSAQGREKWGSILERHLIPRFGAVAVDELRRHQVEAWRADIGKTILSESVSPNTANTWLAVLRVIVNAAVAEYELEKNPMLGVKPFDTSEWETYSEEQPNALEPSELPRFLELMRSLYPQYLGIAALGFSTGQRPSTLRPLRRRGEKPDILWDDGVLLIRRSHTVRDIVM